MIKSCYNEWDKMINLWHHGCDQVIKCMTLWVRLCNPLMTQWVRPGEQFMRQWVRPDDHCMRQYVRPNDHFMRQWVRPDDHFMKSWVIQDYHFTSWLKPFMALWVRRDDETDIMCESGWSLYGTKRRTRRSIYDNRNKTKHPFITP